MRGKLLFVTGLAAGYVIGARAGRPAYDALTARLDGVASSPRAREVAADAKAALEEKAPAVAGALEQTAAAKDTVAAVQEVPATTSPAEQEESKDAGSGAGRSSGSRRVRSSGGAPAKADG